VVLEDGPAGRRWLGVICIWRGMQIHRTADNNVGGGKRNEILSRKESFVSDGAYRRRQRRAQHVEQMCVTGLSDSIA